MALCSAAAASPQAATPAPALSPRPPATANITFMCRGFVDVLELSVRVLVNTLCEQLCEQLQWTLKIELTPVQLRLKTLPKIDDEWPTEEAAKDAKARPTTICNAVGTEFEGVGSEGRVHLLVGLPEDAEDKEVKQEKL
ncbi:unnamed protein product [Phytophthora fragariaefolia]|uniref:Unnamed protein product n=1 Tax=Phytophthora fragariaefolia TaxID=1490495 RepID=A0A9W6XM46_9STRA|nr:unnamed protein product [Phytophthora fragariaefolia]